MCITNEQNIKDCQDATIKFSKDRLRDMFETCLRQYKYRLISYPGLFPCHLVSVSLGLCLGNIECCPPDSCLTEKSNTNSINKKEN